MIGIPKLTIEGREYKLDWGNRHVTITGGEKPVKIDNVKLSRMLGYQSLHDAVKNEVMK